VRFALLIVAAAGILLAQQSTEEIDLRKKAAEANPQDAEAHARLGIAYRDAGQFSKAAQALEKSLELNPGLPRVPILLAFVYMTGGRYTDAVPILRRAFETEQQPSMRLIVGQRLVECLFTTGGEEEALKVVGELRRLTPDDPDVLYLASKAYANLWNATVQRLLEKSADSYRAHQLLAEVLETQEKFGEAAAEYRAIIRLQPRMPAFHYKLGKMLLRADPTSQGEAAAMTEFRAELDINPFDVPSHVEIGELELKAGRVEDAYKLFSRAVALQPGHAAAQLGLARALIASRRSIHCICSSWRRGVRDSLHGRRTFIWTHHAHGVRRSQRKEVHSGDNRQRRRAHRLRRGRLDGYIPGEWKHARRTGGSADESPVSQFEEWQVRRCHRQVWSRPLGVGAGSLRRRL
jgi:tetratricopeptide (TPR) repeat protein